MLPRVVPFRRSTSSSVHPIDPADRSILADLVDGLVYCARYQRTRFRQIAPILVAVLAQVRTLPDDANVADAATRFIDSVR